MEIISYDIEIENPDNFLRAYTMCKERGGCIGVTEIPLRIGQTWYVDRETENSFFASQRVKIGQLKIDAKQIPFEGDHLFMWLIGHRATGNIVLRDYDGNITIVRFEDGGFEKIVNPNFNIF